MQQMSCRWRLLGTEKERDQFQNLEGSVSNLCSQLHVCKQFLMGFLCAFVFLWLCFVHENKSFFMKLLGHWFGVARN